MKLDRLTSTSPLPQPGAPAGQPLAPVAPISDAGADRRRSRRQELEEMEAKAIGPFEGQDRVQQSAHEVAEKLASLGPQASELVRTGYFRPLRHNVDDKA